MSDIEYWDETLNDELEVIQKLLGEIPSMSKMDKAVALSDCEKRLRQAQGTKRSYKMETRLVSDVDSRRAYETRLHRLDQQLMAAQADCKALKAAMERDELFVSVRSDSGEGGRVSEDDAQKAGDDLLKDASALQDKTQTSLDNTKNLIAESKEVGMATLEELERQREVLNSIDNELDRVDTNLERAQQLIKQFSKRMASDKFIQCFAAINCMLLLGCVFYVIYNKGGLSGSDSGSPSDPLDVATGARGLLRKGF